MDRRQQHPGRGDDAPVERQFADRDMIAELLGIGHPHRRQQRERDRQVVVRAFLGQVGRGEVDGDPLGRQCEAERGQRRLHALAALVHRLVGQSDEVEARQPRRDLALHLDRARLEPEIGDCIDARDQPFHPTAARPEIGVPARPSAVEPGCLPLLAEHLSCL